MRAGCACCASSCAGDRCSPFWRSRELPQRLERLPALLRPLLQEAYERLVELQRHLDVHTRRIQQLVHSDPLCQRLMGERGVGPMVASADVATIADPTRYRNGRQVSASLGIVPRQHSSGGKPTLLGISKRGDRYLRMLLIHGARAVIRHLPRKTDRRFLEEVSVRGYPSGPQMRAISSQGRIYGCNLPSPHSSAVLAERDGSIYGVG